MVDELKLWLWRNFVDGKPEYWAFDNPFPCHEGGDPITLGEPCGWAIFKRSENARPLWPDSEVEAAIERARTPPEVSEEMVERLARQLYSATYPAGSWADTSERTKHRYHDRILAALTEGK
jgi:hypothetical protein